MAEMVSDPIPMASKGLSEDDRALLRAFIGGAAFPVFMKLMEDGLLVMYRQMESASNPQDIFRIQGRIQGMRYAMNAPVNLSGLRADELSKLKGLSQPPKKPRDPRLPK